MNDLFDHTVLCQNCQQSMSRKKLLQEGFPLRFWECADCHSKVIHPGDAKDFEEYQRLRNQQFNVKLRMVGNSFCISIPREIIYFHQELQRVQQQAHQQIQREFQQEKSQKKELSAVFQQVVRLHLEEPGKIGLFFTSTSRRDHFPKKHFPEQSLYNPAGAEEDS